MSLVNLFIVFYGLVDSTFYRVSHSHVVVLYSFPRNVFTVSCLAADFHVPAVSFTRSDYRKLLPVVAARPCQYTVVNNFIYQSWVFGDKLKVLAEQAVNPSPVAVLQHNTSDLKAVLRFVGEHFITPFNVSALPSGKNYLLARRAVDLLLKKVVCNYEEVLLAHKK